VLGIAGCAGGQAPAPQSSPDGAAPSARDGAAPGGAVDGPPGATGIACSPPVAADAGPPAPGMALPARARPFLTPRPHAPAQQWLDKFTEAQWLALVPRQSPRDPSFGGCHPAGSTGLRWDPLDPDHISYLDATGAVVAVLPADGDGHTFVSVTVPGGKTVQVPVWTVAGATCYVQQTIDYQKSQFLFDRLEDLAAGYENPATRKEDFARRIALALDEWASYLPDYYLTGENSGAPLAVADAEKKHYSVVQRVSDHNGVGHELDRGPVIALDAIHDSPTLAALSQERGHDVRQRIIDDYFVNQVDFLLTKIPIETHVATNLSGTPEQLALLATVLGRSDWIEWLDRYMQLTVVHLMRDGMDGESFSYCYGYLTANRATTQEMTAYFDVWPPQDDARRAIQAGARSANGTIERGLASITEVLLPDGTVPPFGNTNFNGNGKKRDATRSQLLPGYGHLTLGDGTGADQTQVNLNFVDNANHDEEDVLTFTLFGAASELIGDLRYSRMPGRPFTESSMAHNVVVVDRKTQYRGTNQDTGNRGHLFTGGDLLLFEPNLDGVSVAEVDGARAYAPLGPTTRYQRMQVLNAVDPAHPYLVDLFRVHGGSTHDYFIHGATRFDETTPPPDRSAPAGASTLPLAYLDGAYPLLEAGETFVEPPMDKEPWYGAFRDVWTARSNGNWSVTFKASAGPQGTRISMVDEGDSDVFVAKSPAPFRDKMPPETPAAFYAYWRPSLMVRHTGADSLFVSVIEPFSGAPALAGIERLALPAKDLDHVALRVRFQDGREDVLLAALADPAAPAAPAPAWGTADGALSLEGRVGVVSRRGTSSERAVMVAATRFDHDGKRLTADAAILSGAVTRSLRAADGCSANAFVTDTPLPPGTALAGRWIILTFGSYRVIPASGGAFPLGIQEQKGIRQPYRIDHVERSGNQTLVVLADDPMLTSADGKWVETTRPGRTFEGPVRFEISLARGPN
jgi:hypothetical protein